MLAVVPVQPQIECQQGLQFLLLHLPHPGQQVDHALVAILFRSGHPMFVECAPHTQIAVQDDQSAAQLLAVFVLLENGAKLRWLHQLEELETQDLLLFAEV